VPRKITPRASDITIYTKPGKPDPAGGGVLVSIIQWKVRQDAVSFKLKGQDNEKTFENVMTL
jgi:hypothetical protein